MRVPIGIAVAWALGREIVRTLGTPFHTIAFLLGAAAWRERAAAALARSRTAAVGDALREFLDRRGPGPSPRGHLFLSCGEASGEGHAVALVDALGSACGNARRAPPRVSCFGGERLRAAGAEVRFELTAHAIMGFLGVLRALPIVLRAYATFLRMLRDDRPDLIVLVDYPGLHLVMAETARRHGVPVIHYVAPQYWAWAPWRMRRYRRAVDATLTILPFEPAFFADHGVPGEYVGHPLVDATAARRPHAARDDARPLLCMMPGSRRRELELHVGPMADVARRLRAERPDLRIVLPCRDGRRVPVVRALLERAGAADLVEVHQGDPGTWLGTCRAAIVKSGTGALEACLHGAPTVVVYVVAGPVGRWFLRHMLTVPYFALANLCMNRAVVPEVAIEHPHQWDDVLARTAELLADGPRRADCLRDLGELRARLGEPGASARAVRWLLPFCRPLEATA